MPIKYAVPAGSARTRVLTALAARYTGGTVRGWDVLDGLDTHPASQNSGRFGYPFGKTRDKIRIPILNHQEIEHPPDPRLQVILPVFFSASIERQNMLHARTVNFVPVFSKKKLDQR